MRCLLIIPTFHYKDNYPSHLSFSDFPTGYGYIASALKQTGHEVIGLNLNNDTRYHSAYEMVRTRIEKALQDKPDLIAIGGICIDYKFIKDAISIIRQTNPNIPIVLGGGIVTNDAEYIFGLLKPDYAIVGEAETAIVRLANGEIEDNERIIREPQADINNIPLPDYEPFGIQEMLDDYSMSTRVLYRYSRPYARPFSIVASRGCPFSCTFCVHNNGHHARKYRARSIESIMAEIKVSYEKYHYNILILLDELFAVNKTRMREFCFGISEGKLKYGWDFDWMFQTHASAKLDKPTLDLAKNAGCFFFSYGIESASPAVLKSMDKKTKVPQIIEAIKLAHESKIGFGGNLIFGDFAETSETIAESFDFYLNYGKATMLFPGFLMPYPGSKLFDDCVEKKIIPDKLHYYETIDQVRYNMTSITRDEWLLWMSFIEKMANNWWGVENCEATRLETDTTVDPLTEFWKLPYYKVWAKCPYCGEEIMYRNILPITKTFMGVGCTKCNKKIKVNIGARNGMVRAE